MFIMANVKLEALPKELIAHVACCGDAESVLNLSRTNHRIRAACYDSLVFKDLLTASQQSRWKQNSLDVNAIASRAGNDVVTWARYALADQRAWELSKKECPLEIPKNFINYMPELFVARHPFMNEQCWKRFLRDPLDQQPCQIFCLLVAILASDDDMPQAHKSLDMQEALYLSRDESMTSFLWALCTIALTLRRSLRARLAAWPYNHAAVVPYMTVPKITHIPLQPLSERYSLPAPFTRRAVELLGPSTTGFSSWDSWYRLHNYEAFQSLTCLTRGEWCGYYIHFGVRSAYLDPPMTNIRIRLSATGFGEGIEIWPAEIGAATLHATECRDGIDTFSIHGTIRCRDNEVKLSARKQYVDSTGWDWDLRLTPFGFVGYWGTKNAQDGELKRYGIVWLWKKEWVEVPPQS